jgi:hypothetical protein
MTNARRKLPIFGALRSVQIEHACAGWEHTPVALLFGELGSIMGVGYLERSHASVEFHEEFVVNKRNISCVNSRKDSAI